jgi:hypothetical protein
MFLPIKREDKTPAMFWWSHLDRVLSAFDDLSAGYFSTCIANHHAEGTR